MRGVKGDDTAAEPATAGRCPGRTRTSQHTPPLPAGFSLAGGALWASLTFVLAFAFYIATVSGCAPAAAAAAHALLPMQACRCCPGAPQALLLPHCCAPSPVLLPNPPLAAQPAPPAPLACPPQVIPAEERMLREAFGDKYER